MYGQLVSKSIRQLVRMQWMDEMSAVHTHGSPYAKHGQSRLIQSLVLTLLRMVRESFTLPIAIGNDSLTSKEPWCETPRLQKGGALEGLQINRTVVDGAPLLQVLEF